VARANFEEAGLDEYIELRKGDLRETLQNLVGPVDFLLLDIWEVALPALELVAPHLRRGAIVVCDNTTAFADHYRGYFEFIEERKDEFRTMTVPFEGGFELTIRF
jgi:predicted O-methyltransferase YrrM